LKPPTVMKTISFHRGRTVLAAAAVGVFMTTPGQTVGVSPFVDVLAKDLGLMRGDVILLYSLGTLLGILPAPVIGRLVDKYGPRRMIGLAALALGISCAAMGVATGPWTLVFAFTLLRGSAIGGISLTSLYMVNLWFDRWRGRAIAIAMIGLALGGLTIPRLAEYLTNDFGWRTAYFMLGLSVVTVMLPVGVLFFRNRPQEYALSPDRRGNTIHSEREFTLAKAAHTPVFWYLLSLAVLFNAFGTALLLDHIRLIESTGADRAAAIQLLGLVPVAQVLATLGGGFLVDTLGSRRTGLIGISLTVLTLACVMTTPYALGGFVYVILLGIAVGLTQVAQSAGLAEHFGTRHLGSIQGTVFVVGIFGAALGPLPLVWSPQIAHWIFVAFAGLAIALGLMSETGHRLAGFDSLK
jgi:MFS family permease